MLQSDGSGQSNSIRSVDTVRPQHRSISSRRLNIHSAGPASLKHLRIIATQYRLENAPNATRRRTLRHYSRTSQSATLELAVRRRLMIGELDLSPDRTAHAGIQRRWHACTASSLALSWHPPQHPKTITKACQVVRKGGKAEAPPSASSRHARASVIPDKVKMCNGSRRTLVEVPVREFEG